jgi:hypothetical protein
LHAKAAGFWSRADASPKAAVVLDDEVHGEVHGHADTTDHPDDEASNRA